MSSQTERRNSNRGSLSSPTNRHVERDAICRTVQRNDDVVGDVSAISIRSARRVQASRISSSQGNLGSLSER